MPYYPFNHDAFIKRLPELRRKNGNLSKNGFSRLIGLPAATVTGWEKQLHIPRADTIYAICREFHVSADWLLGLKEDPYEKSV